MPAMKLLLFKSRWNQQTHVTSHNTQLIANTSAFVEISASGRKNDKVLNSAQNNNTHTSTSREDLNRDYTIEKQKIMRNRQRPLILRSIPLPLLLLLTLFTAKFAWLAEAGKGRIVHIPDELDDVVDDEEDEEWRNWGKKKEKQPDDDDEPPPDFDNMDPAQIQDELMKRNTGPVFGFVKLRLGVKRTKDTVTEIARKWTKVLKTGGTDLNFVGVDLSTIMFTLQGGQDADEVKEFLLGQPDAYEVKIGDRVFQRPGDPSVEEILEKQYREKVEAENQKKEEL